MQSSCLLNFTLDVFTTSIHLLLNFIQGKLSFTLDSITLIHSSIEYIHTCGLQQLASEFWILALFSSNVQKLLISNKEKYFGVIDREV